MVSNDSEIPSLVLCDSDEDDFGSSDEEKLDEEPTRCLFCEQILSTIELAIAHLKSKHEFDLSSFKAKFGMDQYSYIKLINYIRVHSSNPESLIAATSPIWDDEKYLKPVDYEPWLSYDFEELPVSIETVTPDVSKVSIEKYRAMEKLVASLTEKVKQKDLLLEQAFEDMDKMRNSFRHFVEKDTSSHPEKSQNNDEGYFNSYAHFGIHYDMLSDSVRTLSYRDALLNNKALITGKAVLDVGCGTSVLSMFASQAGAKEVVGIDNSDIIYNAMEVVRKNNFTNISLVKGRVEDTRLPIEQFDIIVSEWMGYFLFFEGMLDSVIYARDKYLKPGGVLLPNRCSISLVGYGDMAYHDRLIKFWDSVCGLDMTPMKREILHEPQIEICKPEHVLTEPVVLVDYDLNTVELNYPNFEYDFQLKCTKVGRLMSFVGYFDTFFELPNKVEFSTSPSDTPTHWKQVVFLLEKPVDVEKDEVIYGKLVCGRSSISVRSLEIDIYAFGEKFTYVLD